MSEGTKILEHIQHGDPHAATQLIPLVYGELREMRDVSAHGTAQL